MKYIPGLNGLRALAVLNVIFFHWGLPPFANHESFEKFVPNGNFGVNVFFVLSGFLITGLLLIEKTRLTDSYHSTQKIILRFYARRFLRIFPIYYLTLFALYFSSLPGFRSNFFYYLTYTENFNVLRKQSWDSFSHTWSLAVEEQFYLVWPFVIILVRKTRLVPVILFFILLGPAFSIFQTCVLKPGLNAFILAPSCFDSFSIGALLAYYYTENNWGIMSKCIKWLLPLSLLLFFYWMFAPMGGHFQFLKRFFQSIIACGFILFCLSPSHKKWRAVLLDNGVLNWLGLVSYGLYLYHYALPWFYGKAKENLNFSFGKYDGLIDYFLMFVLLLLVCALSYYFIEKPILRYKKRFAAA